MTYLQIGKEPSLHIVYEDKALIAVSKPAGQLFHGHAHGFPSPLVDQVKNYLKSSKRKMAGVYLGVVHRLDRPVSGLSLFACNSKAAQRLSAQFQERSLRKIYLAVVEGDNLPAEGVWEDELESPPGEGPVKLQNCRLSYQNLAVENGCTLVAIELGTGRRHQIRMQFAKRSWPILGDKIYGGRSVLPFSEGLDARFQAIALHAAALHFAHPLTFTPQRLTAPLPFYWPELGERLTLHSQSFLNALR